MVIKMEKKPSDDMMVMIRAKELCTLILKVTNNMPKQYRYTLAQRPQNMSMEIIEYLYMANEVYVTKDNANGRYEERRQLKQKALTRVKMVAYFATLALEHNAILMKQFKSISSLCHDCQNLIAAWVSTDKKRFGIK